MTETTLPEPRPLSKWHEVVPFSAAEEILTEPGLKTVFKAAIERAFAIARSQALVVALAQPSTPAHVAFLGGAIHVRPRTSPPAGAGETGTPTTSGRTSPLTPAAAATCTVSLTL
jgi:hypothetical protein